jgi:hypothetical protein
MKRGPKGKFSPALQRHICAALRKCNTLKTAAESARISEQTLFSWLRTKPLFALAVDRARSRAKQKLVKVLTDASRVDWRAASFLLERGWPGEYARTETRIIEQKAEEPKMEGFHVYYDVGNGTLAELLDFPKHQSLIDHERELLAEQANANAAETTDDAEPEISDAPPPKVVDKRSTGSIRPEGKTNNGQP